VDSAWRESANTVSMETAGTSPVTHTHTHTSAREN